MFKLFYFNPLRECTYVLDNGRGECVIIDPGANGGREHARLVDYIDQNGLTVKGILLTHGHFDHILGLTPAAQKWQVPVYMNAADKGIFDSSENICEALGLPYEPYRGQMMPLEAGPLRVLDGVAAEVIATPGHTPGSVCFYLPEEGLLLSGDTIFMGSVGRCDLDGGNAEHLNESLRKLVGTLPAATRILPGHGKETTLEAELATNPFLQWTE